MSPRKSSLQFMQLEDRLTPSSLGSAWPDTSGLTLSFVPDGTSVSGIPSQFQAVARSVETVDRWQNAVFSAFESWAKAGSISLAKVADNGAALGVAGLVQGDSRFGDIRIAAVPLPAGTLATNAGFQWTGTTWSGDVVLNSNYAFSTDGKAGTYDLYTVMLNEAGNVFGVPDSVNDSTSAVFYQYNQPKNGPTASDIAAIRNLYSISGSRAGQFDYLKSGNIDSKSTLKTTLQAPNSTAIHSLNVIVATGDVKADVPKITIAGDGQNAVAYATTVLANSQGVYSVQLDNVQPNAKYTISVGYKSDKVSAAKSATVMAEFTPHGQVVHPIVLTSGTLASKQTEVIGFTLAKNQLIDFQLKLTGSIESFALSIVDQDTGKVVFGTGKIEGNSFAKQGYLPAGSYALLLTAVGAESNFGYSIKVRTLSDPIGPAYTEPTGGLDILDGDVTPLTPPPNDNPPPITLTPIDPILWQIWDIPYHF